MKKLCLLAFALALLASCSGDKTEEHSQHTAPADAPAAHSKGAMQATTLEEAFVGTWRAFHANGEPFTIVIKPGGIAESSVDSEKGGKQSGTWRVAEDALRVEWSDGWKDMIHYGEGGFEHLGFAPGTGFDGQPANKSKAEKVHK